jgi:hypothetical protein
MNERMLRNALGHFGKALAREKEVHALREGYHAADESRKVGDALGDGDVKDKLRMKHGTAKVAQTFIDEVGAPLLCPASRADAIIRFSFADKFAVARGSVR